SDTIVKIFDDHISIYNPGKLPQGITIRNLLSGQYVSTPRNHQIADIFKEAGIIEKYGSGIRRIRESFKKASNREPLFEEIGEGFMVTHYAEGPRFCRGMNAPSASGCRTSSLRLREPKEIFGAADSCRRGSTVNSSGDCFVASLLAMTCLLHSFHALYSTILLGAPAD
ncbi:MAG TPA: ATP-binding protein, partial [Chitinivibrionales bacterium]|nr:ATP-binding protein [Chitinivibrionales bacterium]